MLVALAICATVIAAALLTGLVAGSAWYALCARPGKGPKPELWRRATYRSTPRPHPHTDAGLRTLRQRRPQDWLEDR